MGIKRDGSSPTVFYLKDINIQTKVVAFCTSQVHDQDMYMYRRDITILFMGLLEGAQWG